MNITDYYKKWLNNNEGISFIEYYNKYNNTRWDRSNKQRNYKRNKDIIYKSPLAKRVNQRITYKLVGINDGDFYFDGQYLRYKYNEVGYSAKVSFELIRPYTYITMDVNNNLILTADIPMLVNDASFEIIDGNLIFSINEQS